MKLNLLFIFILLFISCSDNTSKSDYDTIKAELDECKRENNENQKLIDELRETKEQRLAEANKLYEEKKYKEANEKYEILVNRYPGTEISKKAENYLIAIQLILKKQVEEQERLKTLGFKALKETNRVKIGDVTINFNNISFAKNFVFDRYDDTYHYSKAERENKFVIASV